MLKNILSFLFLTFFASNLIAQNTIKGSFIDSVDKQTLPGANIRLIQIPDTTKQSYVVTDNNGKFIFTDKAKGTYIIEATFVGFNKYRKLVEVSGNVDLGTLILAPNIKALKEVVVKAQDIMAIKIGDTTQFNADAFKTQKNASTEDLVQKMPGVTMENGVIKAQGEEVKRVMVDGKPFFGDDPSMALKNLPAEVVDKIQIFDGQSDQSSFTKFNDGNTTKTMNIITKASKRNGAFGKMYAGYGTDDRYQSGGNMNYFKGSRRISLMGMSNNINQQNFSMQDLLGVMGGGSSGGMGGNMMRMMGASRGGGSPGMMGGMGEFMTGNQNGISQSHALGLNYSDNWGKKTEVTGSYFVNSSNNNNQTDLFRETFTGRAGNQLYTENSTSNLTNLNHRISMRFEYKIDTFNSLVFTPKLNFQSAFNNKQTNGLTQNYLFDTINRSNIFNYGENNGYNMNNSLLWRHRFTKDRRTFSATIGNTINSKYSLNDLNSINDFYSLGNLIIDSIDQRTNSFSDSKNYNANVVYTEPSGKFGMIQLSVNGNYTMSNSDRQTKTQNTEMVYNVTDSTLSNTFDNLYFTRKAGASYRYAKGKVNINGGLNYQYATLSSDQTFPLTNSFSVPFSNILPEANLALNISKEKNLRLIYRTSTNAPSISQLQSVVDNSNPLNISMGNPNLKQEYSSTYIARFSNIAPQKSRMFFSLLSFTNTANYISNTTLIAQRDTIISDNVFLGKGAQLSMPTNLGNYYNGRAFGVFGFPVKKIKSNINFNSGVTYQRIPALINNINNISNSVTFSQGMVIASNISEKVDFTLSYTGSYNITKNEIVPQQNNNYFNHFANVKTNITLFKKFVLNTDITHQLYTGLSSSFNQSFFLVNGGLSRRFMKNEVLEVKASVFDLFKQNNSLNRTINETYIEDNRTLVLQRYFMLTATYNFRKFKAS